MPQQGTNAPSESLDFPAASSSAPAAAFMLQVQAPDAVREHLEQHLPLQRFRQFSDLQASELQRLLGTTDADARELLGTLGYFASTITVEMHEPPSMGPLPAIVVTVEPGPQTHVSRADISFAEPAQTDAPAHMQLQRVQENWSLPPGEAFTQSAWDRAKNDGLRQLRMRRFPTARIAQSRAEIDADTNQATLSMAYDPGPVYRFGPLRVQGANRYDPDGLRRLARLPTGAIYDEAQLLDAQLRLASSGYYNAVFLVLDTEGPDPGAAPVIAQVREAPLQKMVFGVGLSTDSGPRISVDHAHNRLPGLGWRAVSKLTVERNSKLLDTQWTGLPDEKGWRWFTGGQVQRETTGDYEVNSGRLRAGRSKDTVHIDRNYFLQYDYALAQGLHAPPSGSALTANYSWTANYFNSPTAPTRGHGLAIELGGGLTLRPERNPFVRALVRWQSFIPVGDIQASSGTIRSARLALRLQAGAVFARNSAEVPATQLFLTGGDTTVRGYGYRSIGERTEDGQLYAGRYLALASAEWQRPILYRGEMTEWESALFVDAGAVADRASSLKARVGIGAGVRWRSPVGPLQADLAYGLQSKQLRLHLRMGFSF